MLQEQHGREELDALVDTHSPHPRCLARTRVVQTRPRFSHISGQAPTVRFEGKTGYSR